MNETIRFAVGETWLGAALVACTDAGIACLVLGDGRAELAAELRQRFPASQAIEGGRGIAPIAAQALRFVEAPWIGSRGLPLYLHGTGFQLQVWQALRAIPAGRTASYADIAHSIGRPAAARAVARACSANPVAVLVPCHRIVRRDGFASGYRWGVERKRRLLAREAAAGPALADHCRPSIGLP
ncbi:MAG: methylated-DNA--[protein]-cysteine S-methyltransferase [Rhodospirillales bacterium]|nr:methylated-DNA--[protein]-cysteine S-methyltransferase [Rhodospirillales bacterium]